MARGNGPQSIIIPLGHFALILVALFIVSTEADKAGEAKATAVNATTAAQDARMEARLLQSKVESDRREIAELKGIIEGVKSHEFPDKSRAIEGDGGGVERDRDAGHTRRAEVR